ncbi:MAG: universal stress protein [Desulfobacula sp.]|jgi:nucleotide-binding universal stress UspA family protein|nr:universal stress protein [Desulfobacula sp.]
MRVQPKKIMCAIDFSDFSNIILAHGKSLASQFGSSLCLCHVVTGTLMVSSLGHSYIHYTDIETDRMHSAKEKLEKMADELDIECEVIVSSGHVADEIDQLVRKNNIDMVIAATHGGSGIKRFLVGSVTDRLVKILQCPLLVLITKEDHLTSEIEKNLKLKRILVGCDFSPDSRLAFDYALSLAQEFQTQLYLAHVVRPTEQIELPASDYIKIQGGDYTNWTRAEYLDLQKNKTDEHLKNKNSLFSRLERQLSYMIPEDSKNWCTPINTVLEGQPYKELIDYAEQKEMDMIVVGVHGHSLLERFIVGSTAERVISQACCPVLVVRQIS